MNPLFVVIAAAGHDAEALLAAEALRHAAGQRPLAVEVRASGGVIGEVRNPNNGQPLLNNKVTKAQSFGAMGCTRESSSALVIGQVKCSFG